MDSSEKIMCFIEIRQAPECNLASLLDGERHVFLQLCEGKEHNELEGLIMTLAGFKSKDTEPKKTFQFNQKQWLMTSQEYRTSKFVVSGHLCTGNSWTNDGLDDHFWVKLL